MLHINTNIFNNFYLNKPLQKNSFKNNSSKVLNKDTFQKLNTINLSFEGDKNNHKPKRTLIEVKKDILRLMCSVLIPSKINFDGSGYFVDALEHGSTLEEAIKNMPFKDFNVKKLDEIVGSKTIREHLLDFEKLQEKLQPLYEELESIEEYQAAHPIKPAELSTEIKAYINCASKSNASYASSPNYSKPLRYKQLIKPFINMLNDNISLNKPAKILLIGLGNNNEELYDYSLYSLLSLKTKNQSIKDILNLEMLDYRPKENFLRREYTNLMSLIYLNNDKIPFNNELSKLLIEHPFLNSKTYPLEVMEFVANQLEDDSKFHHSTPIEDFSANYNGEGYDFISINNVLQYVGQAVFDDTSTLPDKYRFFNPFKVYKIIDDKEFYGYRNLLNNLFKMVKPGGLISCQFDSAAFDRILYDQLSRLDLFNNEFEEVQNGLYRRKKIVS